MIETEYFLTSLASLDYLKTTAVEVGATREIRLAVVLAGEYLSVKDTGPHAPAVLSMAIKLVVT